MNFGVLRERTAFENRVAVTPPVVRQLAEHGNTVWVEAGAGDGAMFRDEEYVRAGAHIAYSPAEVTHRAEIVLKVSVPTLEELDQCPTGAVLMAFYHMAVASRRLLERLVGRSITAIGYEVIQADDGRLPVLAAISEIAGQMTVPVAMHLLRSSSGGRGILLGGSPGVPPAHVVILGAGVVGTWAARTAVAAGARVTVLDVDTEKLRRLLEHLPNLSTALADPDTVAARVAEADVLIGAVLVAGRKTPHVVSRQMVEQMRPGSVIIDVAIDQGGCVETSRPTTLAQPSFVHHGVVHYCVPNLTSDVARSASIALAQALLPFLLEISQKKLEGTLRQRSDLARGVYTHAGWCVCPSLAEALGIPCRRLEELLQARAAG
ncbi:MAG: alanine dehydrogenase [Bryobacterales bacterium]|nr:alanine dehydrogenase [Bryobacteraceae bacterium]MDW8354618.1 alanine dehydrogenase [Bryobacterales bacterium]